MKQGLKLFTFKNIPVYVHWSFGLIVFYILYIAYSSNLNLVGTCWLFGIFMTFFSCVIFHEFGHALMAKKFNISTKDIILTPIGGVARLLRIPKSPKQEALVAIAGPLVNIGIAVIIVAGILIFYSLPEFLLSDEDLDINKLSIARYFQLIFLGNIVLALFNLIPAFPMDGGRILRAMLALKLSRKNATKWATWIGRMIALCFVVYGVYFDNYILALIGIFVFVSAGREYRQIKIDDRLEFDSVEDLMKTGIGELQAEQLISNVDVQGAMDFFVYNEDKNLVGIIDKEMLASAIKINANQKVGDISLKTVIPIDKKESLRKALHLMKVNQIHILPVTDEETIVGALHHSDLFKP